MFRFIDKGKVYETIQTAYGRLIYYLQLQATVCITVNAHGYVTK